MTGGSGGEGKGWIVMTVSLPVKISSAQGWVGLLRFCGFKSITSSVVAQRFQCREDMAMGEGLWEVDATAGGQGWEEMLHWLTHLLLSLFSCLPLS